ncbi:MAG TPA: hypothetical protein VJ622_01765, partial [Acidimicrobiia bacterium]|nr:hypothetical protein [Acidimicrobiia bacterium]
MPAVVRERPPPIPSDGGGATGPRGSPGALVGCSGVLYGRAPQALAPAPAVAGAEAAGTPAAIASP